MCVYIYIYIMCGAWTGSSSEALVLLQGAVMSSSHLSTVSSHQHESQRSSSLRGEVCVVCVHAEPNGRYFEVEFCLCLCLFKHILKYKGRL